MDYLPLALDEIPFEKFSVSCNFGGTLKQIFSISKERFAKSGIPSNKDSEKIEYT